MGNGQDGSLAAAAAIVRLRGARRHGALTLHRIYTALKYESRRLQVMLSDTDCAGMSQEQEEYRTEALRDIEAMIEVYNGLFKKGTELCQTERGERVGRLLNDIAYPWPKIRLTPEQREEYERNKAANGHTDDKEDDNGD